jgi:two-component system, chemotaxis family, chemotaxis protein CheY
MPATAHRIAAAVPAAWWTPHDDRTDRLKARAEAMQTDQLKLPAVLDLNAAEDFLATLRQHLQGESALRLDASAVETLTLPCIQILVAAMRDHGQIAIDQPSNEFANAFRDLGLTWTEGEPQAEPESVQQLGEPEADQPQAEADQSPAEEVQAQPAESPVDENHFDQVQKDACDMAKRILTIDDSKTIRDMLMLTLSDAGFDVLQAVDGQDGLDVLGDDRVDVIITDINMPRMDGYEVIRQLRKNSVHKATPILVLTTESDVDKRNLARDAGATGWMVKPFDPERLIATVRKVAP